MKITFHRGLDQIGGCITEIRTATTQVFIDMGQNLPGVGDKTTFTQDDAMVTELLSNGRREHLTQAIFYTHAHEDHVGLFNHVDDEIPQYIGEGAKEILIAKYELIKKERERRLKEEPDSRQKWIGVLCAELCLSKLNSFKTWKRTSRPHPITIGDIKITPFFNCHSIYDSYMFLIEAEGKRIWHTGDYRKHGYMGKGLIPTLRRYATNIDLLITEGTMLGRADECIHENEVSRKMANVMDSFKYVVVLASSTDIERLASIKEAAKKAHKCLYVCSSMMKNTMSIFTRREAERSKGLFEFHPRFVKNGDTKTETMRKKGFVLITGVSNKQLAEELTAGLNPLEVVFIYSSWDGYYKDPEQVAINPLYKEFRDSFDNAIDIHTSGHADIKTIKEVVKTVNPKNVVCIHKEINQSLDLSEELKNRIINTNIIEL